jgi:hypothetical protein
MALFIGARLNELAPLTTTDVITDAATGIVSINIKEDQQQGVAATLDAGPWKGISKLVPSDADLACVGWEFIKGKRGNGSRPALFRRLRPEVSVFPMAA